MGEKEKEERVISQYEANEVQTELHCVQAWPGLCRDGTSETWALGTSTPVSLTGKTAHAQMTLREEGTRDMPRELLRQ